MVNTQKEILFPEESYAINGAIFEVHLSLFYKGEKLQHDFFADFVCYGKIIIELKSTIQLEGKYISQVINYLKATNFQLGLLVNFQQDIIKPLRITNNLKTCC